MSLQTGLGAVINQRTTRARNYTQAFMNRAHKVGKLLKARTSRLACFGAPDRLEQHLVVLAGNYLFWTNSDISGVEDCSWSYEMITMQDCFQQRVSLAVPDCQVVAVQDSTRFMIVHGCVDSAKKTSILFEAGSEESRDEWVKQIAAQVERCNLSAFRSIRVDEEAEPLQFAWKRKSQGCATHTAIMISANNALRNGSRPTTPALVAAKS
eukprot:CAMPEP_0197625990 /NCGR_PEP_ID=MMETSP1338-20131121/5170_1 /TAXON_ID=43686 ORGANISM="Pelagodinium beii, Strain RCC1491" /NCGR_SAMPLE_ID=MMETSP1338 /ASSEMBLY_ACC=CAM_ASM_000754 /LENGTH=209 /DNA_ID=CAMNT_0043196505 /DNA_START=49 /DNA_END=679 /DNA_ORIENTATION=-